MRILTLAIKDLKQLFQNKMTAFFLLIMPVMFTLMFGFMFGGFSSGEEVDPRLPVAVLDLDGSGLSEKFTGLLDSSYAVRPVTDEDFEEEELRARVQEGELAGGVIIPEGFESQLLAAGTPTILVIENKDTVSTNITIENAILTAFNRLYTSALAATISQEFYLENDNFLSTDDQKSFVNNGIDLALEAWETPAVETKATKTAAGDPEDGGPFGSNAFSQTSPAMMAQFAIAGLIGAGEMLVAERRSRTMARMLTSRISKAEILFGHYLAIFVMIFLQLVVLAAFGQLFLKLDYFSRPLATLAVVAVTAMATAAIGLLIGALAKTSDQAVLFSLLPMFLLSGLGGAWVPLEYTNQTVQTISKLTPVAWTLEGLKDILLRGAGIADVWMPVVALLGFTVLFFGLAVWRFRFEGE